MILFVDYVYELSTIRAITPKTTFFQNYRTPFIQVRIQWNLDLSFSKGVEKTNDECGETINPENHFF
jgi:hypothetical protein